MRELERQVLLQVMDRKWREHLYEMDYLKEGIGLRAMAQRDPLIEYQREGFDMSPRCSRASRRRRSGTCSTCGSRPRQRTACRDGKADAKRRTRSAHAAEPRRSPRPDRTGGPGVSRASAPPASRRGPRAVRAAGTRRPRATPLPPRACCPPCSAAARGRRRSCSTAARPRRGHRPAAAPVARARRRRRPEQRRAGPEPAVPVRLGPQVQALPRDADGRPPLGRGRWPRSSRARRRVHGMRPQAEIMGDVREVETAGGDVVDVLVDLGCGGDPGADEPVADLLEGGAFSASTPARRSGSRRRRRRRTARARAGAGAGVRP